MNVRIQIIEVHQPICTFYIAKISGTLLYDMAKADIMTISRSSENELYEGIQRNLIESKVKSIEDYLYAYDAYFGDIRTMIPELSGHRIGIIRTPYRNYPDTLSS